MKYRVMVTAQARARINDQVLYMGVEARSPLNAERWLGRVLEAISSLETMPRRCALAPENGFHSFEIRAISVDGYLLLFTVNDDEGVVNVLNARHARQLPRGGGASPSP